MIINFTQLCDDLNLPPQAQLFSLFYFVLISLLFVFAGCQQQRTSDISSEDPVNGGLLLPDGFEAMVVVDSIGPARHLVVNGNGDIYVKLRRAYDDGSIVALRDTNNDGKADIIEKFGVYDTRGNYETGIEIYDGYLYFSTNLHVLRYPLIPGELIPDTTSRDTLVIDNHEHQYHAHQTKPISFDDQGYMYIPFGAPSDACQNPDRTPGLAGQDPCPELEKHGSIWRFHDDKINQIQEESQAVSARTNPVGTKYSTGIRSVVAMDWNPVDKTLYVLQHGRDYLFRQWPEYYSRWDSAILPAEEFMRITEGSNFGWPYCYYNQIQGNRVLAPEYGGDSNHTGKCSEFDDPVIGFPGHFAPNDLQFYRGDLFPDYYQNGAFIAFHGSTIRDPYPQAGYFVAFVPYNDGEFSQDWDVFANGFAVVDPIVSTSDARHRPVGLAVGPDGSLYIAESIKGKVWRVMYTGDKESFGSEHLIRMKEEKRAASNIRTPLEIDDNLEGDVALGGETIYNTYCAACHSRDGEGSPPRFPPIAETEWVTGDKQRLISIILNGMEGAITVRGEPYNSSMPAHNFLSDEEIAQVLTYIRQNFGNDAGAVTEEEVREVRETMD